MTMRTDDMREIVKGTLDHLRVRLDHRNLVISEEDLLSIGAGIQQTLFPYVDNSADTGGDWDNG
jgi:hypothetical protein